MHNLIARCRAVELELIAVRRSHGLGPIDAEQLVGEKPIDRQIRQRREYGAKAPSLVLPSPAVATTATTEQKEPS